MAEGDVTVFTNMLTDLLNGDHDFGSDVFKLGLINAVVTPTKGQGTPSWDDFSAQEVSTAGGYTAGGEIFTVAASPVTASLFKVDGVDVVLAEDAGGFTNAFWAIFYNSSAAGNPAIAFVDLGGQSEQDSGFACRWNSSGIFTFTN